MHLQIPSTKCRPFCSCLNITLISLYMKPILNVPPTGMLILWIIEENDNAAKSSFIEPGSAEFIYHNAYRRLFLNAVTAACVLLRYISFHVDNRIIVVHTSNTATRHIDKFHSVHYAASIWIKCIAKGIVKTLSWCLPDEVRIFVYNIVFHIGEI